jgi:hypothetical protein
MTSKVYLIDSYITHFTTDNFIDSVDVNWIYVLCADPTWREERPTPPVDSSFSVKVIASSVNSQQSPMIYWKIFELSYW